MAAAGTKTEWVTFERRDHIGFITLDRPEKHNALGTAVWAALDEAISRAEEDDETRAVILRGKGKSFCSGLDLGPENPIQAIIDEPASAAQKTRFFRGVRRAMEVHDRLERLRQPTIAAIHGHCVGAGLELALCCDFRLCTETTVFSLPEAKYAVITDVGGLQRLPKIVGRTRAREIIFRGHEFGAAWAQEIELVSEVLRDEDELSARARELADEIARNPPLAIQGSKEVLVFDEQRGLAQSQAYTVARSSMILPSEDLREVRAARRERRTGNFKGA